MKTPDGEEYAWADEVRTMTYGAYRAMCEAVERTAAGDIWAHASFTAADIADAETVRVWVLLDVDEEIRAAAEVRGTVIDWWEADDAREGLGLDDHDLGFPAPAPTP